MTSLGKRAALVWAVVMLLPAAAAAQVTALLADQVIDSYSGKPLRGVAVLVEGERISGVVDAGKVPQPSPAMITSGGTLRSPRRASRWRP